MKKKEIQEHTNEQKLFSDLVSIIENSKQQVAVHINSGIVLQFWQVGKRINEHILNNQRAEYGKLIVSTVSTQLMERYGKNFEEKNLRRMMQFASQFQDFEIVVPLARQLSWSHIFNYGEFATIKIK